jgi:hypothetical protein
MKYGRVSTKHIMFQVGSNELENKEPDDIMEELEKLVEVTWEKVPHTDILFGEILPRFYKDRRLSSVFEEKRLIFNNLIKDFCKESDMSFIEYDQLRFFDYVDGIHLNTVGVSIMVKCIKRVVNSKLGVLTNTNGDDRKGTNTERYRYTYDVSSDNYKTNNKHYRYNQSSDNSRGRFFSSHGNRSRNTRLGNQNTRQERFFSSHGNRNQSTDLESNRAGRFVSNRGKNTEPESYYNRNFVNNYAYQENKNRENMRFLLEGMLKEMRNDTHW